MTTCGATPRRFHRAATSASSTGPTTSRCWWCGCSPEILEHQRLPRAKGPGSVWDRRYEEINNSEKYLVANGTAVVKVFLNVSKQEQKRRFLSRIDEPDKNWKFSDADVKERGFLDKYQEAFEECFNHTSTDARRGSSCRQTKSGLRGWRCRKSFGDTAPLKLAYPEVTAARRKELAQMREVLANRVATGARGCTRDGFMGRGARGVPPPVFRHGFCIGGAELKRTGMEAQHGTDSSCICARSGVDRRRTRGGTGQCGHQADRGTRLREHQEKIQRLLTERRAAQEQAAVTAASSTGSLRGRRSFPPAGRPDGGGAPRRRVCPH